MNILVSACLLGVHCRYDGQGLPNESLCALKDRYSLIPVCPEQLGGMYTPRLPAERANGRVVTSDGNDVTQNYKNGAEEALRLARLFGCELAILKESSPSCGSGRIYDGSFTSVKIPGCGVTTELLRDNGIRVISEYEIDGI